MPHFLNLYMRKISYFADRISDILAKWTLKIVIVLTALMTLTVLLGVLFRYVFLHPLGWTEELARYLMIWAALLAISVGIRYNEHVGITLLIQKLPYKVSRVIRFITQIFILIFLFELTRRGYIMAVKGSTQLSTGLGINMTWALASVPTSAFIAFIQQVLVMIKELSVGKDYMKMIWSGIGEESDFLMTEVRIDNIKGVQR